MSKRITIGSRAVAVGILYEAINQAVPSLKEAEILLDQGELYTTLADRLVSMSWDVEYKARAEKLVLTIDAGISTPDAARSTPETQPPTAGDGSEDDLLATAPGCPVISNGVQCRLYVGHVARGNDHSFGGGMSDPIEARTCDSKEAHRAHAWPPEKAEYACGGVSDPAAAVGMPSA